MAKSIRSKVKKRYRTAKRQRVEAMVIRPREKQQNAILSKVAAGQDFRMRRPKNAFKYPDAPGAVFPQHEITKPIDFRSENLPMAQYAFVGGRRKYEGEQKEYMEKLARDSHPDMEVLAGGGAIEAKTGKRISLKEAHLKATAAEGPGMAAAVAASVAADEAAASQAKDSAAVDMEDGPGLGFQVAAEPMKDEPTNQADHTRPPVLKDARRQARAEEHRPRANLKAVKKAERPEGPTFGLGPSKKAVAGVKKGRVQGKA